MPNSSLPGIVRRRSRLHGFGVFALEPINKNKRIIDYAGELIHNSRSGRREAKYLKEGCIWVFRVNRAWSRDAAVGGNIARFINHSCTPNCYASIVKGHILYMSARAIKAGEELTIDYRFDAHVEKVRCACGSKECRGTINLVK